MRALLLALSLCGCASVATLQTALPVEKGKTVYDFGGIAATDLGRDLFARGPSLGPQIHAGARRGVGDGFDVGYRFWLSGFSADVKVLLKQTDKYAVAIAPGLGLEKTYAFYGVDLYVPIIAQMQLSDDIDLYVAPKAIGRVSLGHGSQLALGAGASVGFAIWLDEHMTILPELVAIWPGLVGEDPCGLQLGPVSASCLRPGAPVVALAVGLQFRR